MNRPAVAMMLARLSVRLSVTGVRRDHKVHFCADLTLRLDSLMFWALRTLKRVYLLPAVFFQFHLEQRWGMDVQTRPTCKH